MKSGDICPQCHKAQLRSESSHESPGSGFHRRWLVCKDRCGFTHTELVPTDEIRRRTAVTLPT